MTKRYPLIGNLLLVAILAVLALSLNPGVRRASAQAEGNRAILYFFWGNGCPHCAEAEPFLKDLVSRYPQMEVRAYEVWYNEQNQALFKTLGTAYGITASGVPGIFLGEKYWIGYSSDIGSEIETSVAACLQNGCKDAGAGVVTGGVVDVWTSASLSQNNLPLIVGLAAGAILLGALAFFVFRPRTRKPVKSVRRHG
jgi:thiol-disulfide isomerase/thioredoxin